MNTQVSTRTITKASSAVTMLLGTGTAFASMMGVAITMAPQIMSMMG